MAALAVMPAVRYRWRWRARAAMTRSRMAEEGSAGLSRRSSENSSAGTSTIISIRSSSGPLIRLRYCRTALGEQAHRPEGSPYQPHLQGFMAQTSINWQGYDSVPATRAMVTRPSSRGWRSTSRVSCRNSGSSSRNSTPRWARDTSPGRGTVPPPARPAAEMV